MNTSRRHLLIGGGGSVIVGNRLFGQVRELSFSLAPLELRIPGATAVGALEVAAYCSVSCRIDIALGGTEPRGIEMPSERTISWTVEGLKSGKLDRKITISRFGDALPRFAVIFAPRGTAQPYPLEQQARQAPFNPQPVQPRHLDGNFLVALESPADVSVEIRKSGSSNLVTFYRVTDRPKGGAVPVRWDLTDNTKKRVGPGLYASDLTLNWKNGLSPKYVVSSVQVDG